MWRASSPKTLMSFLSFSKWSRLLGFDSMDCFLLGIFNLGRLILSKPTSACSATHDEPKLTCLCDTEHCGTDYSTESAKQHSTCLFLNTTALTEQISWETVHFVIQNQHVEEFSLILSDRPIKHRWWLWMGLTILECRIALITGNLQENAHPIEMFW